MGEGRGDRVPWLWAAEAAAARAGRLLRGLGVADGWGWACPGDAAATTAAGTAVGDAADAADTADATDGVEAADGGAAVVTVTGARSETTKVMGADGAGDGAAASGGPADATEVAIPAVPLPVSPSP